MKAKQLTIGGGALVAALLIGGPSAHAASGNSLTRYAVQRGDTLSAVARSHTTTVRYLASVNQLANPDRISVGQILLVPAAAPVAVQQAPAAQPSTTTAEDPASTPDTDNVQQGDQSGNQVEDGQPDTAAGVEATAPDTDTVQQGDQTSPDAGGNNAN